MKTAGLLLAGGASSRFGTEKAVASFGPGLLMDGPLQALAGACDLVAVSAREGSGAAHIAETTGYAVLPDPDGAAAGPLAGVLAGLRWAAGEGADLLATAPCDAATLRPEQVRSLLEVAHSSGHATAGLSPDGLEPLLAVWPVKAGLARLEEALTGGDHPPVRQVLADLGLATLEGFDGVNVNRPGDLLALASSAPAAEEPAHARLFSFEDDFVRTLRCIPMCARVKLDTVGIKLSLRQWSRFTLADRQRLRLLPAGTDGEAAAYRRALVDLIERRTDEPVKPLPQGAAPDWTLPEPPAAMHALAEAQGVSAPTPDAWRRLEPLERYALVKLTRDRHENANLAPALREFGLG